MKHARQTNNPRKLIVHLKPKQKLQPVNPNHWSEKSKRSVTFSIPPSHYEDIHYQCVRCGKISVFTAADQKLAFELHKAYIWQRRKLCQACWREKHRIEQRIHACQTRWRANTRELQHSVAFLKQWLKLLETYSDYGGRKNHAGITMLRRLVDASTKDEEADSQSNQNNQHP